MDDHNFRPQGHHLHPGNFPLAEHAWLINTATHRQLQLFADFQLARLVIRALRQQHDLGTVNSLGFVLMPDRLHWLFQPGPGADPARVIGCIKTVSSRRINARSNTPGRKIWQDGFSQHLFLATGDLRPVARRMVTSPLRAGLVSRIGDYPLWDVIWL